MINELIYKNFDDLSKNIGNLIPLYHCTTKEAVDGICKYGACREYTGKHSNYYGQGFYTTFELGSSIDNQGGYYGKYIVKFGLNGGFENFLFFDKEMNEKYNNGEPIESQIERLCPPDIVEKLKKSDFFVKANSNDGIHHLTNKEKTAGGPREFFLTLRGEKLPTSKLSPFQIENGRELYDELDISRTNVRGYVFVGGNDGEVCVVRDFNSLIPLKYFDPTIGVNPIDESDKGWIDILNKKTFDNISNSIDVGTELRGEYPETPFNSKTICGYILVKGKPAGKYNYINVKTMEELLPIPADYAVDFDPHTGKAKFMINDEEYEYSSKNNTFFEDGIIPYTRDEFEDELRNNISLNEDVNKIISLIKRIKEL